MPWVGGQFSADVPFPADLRIGQGSSRPEVFDVERGIWSFAPKRLRDRDEYLMSMLKDGAAAPEAISVAGVEIAGYTRTPLVDFRSGLSYENRSYSISPDLIDWVPTLTGPTPGYWRNVLFSGGLNIPTPAILHFNCSFSVTAIGKVNAEIQFRLMIGFPGVQVAFTRFFWEAPSPPETLNHGFNWTGQFVPGTYGVTLQLAVAAGVHNRNTLLLGTINAPSLAVFTI